MNPSDLTSSPPRKRRLIILGYFSGDLNQAKRDFFLGGDRWRQTFDEVCILDAGKDKPVPQAGVTWTRFPVWLFPTIPNPWWFMAGLYRVLTMMIRCRPFLMELLKLECLVAYDIGGSPWQWVLKGLYFPIGFVSGLGRTYRTIVKLHLQPEDYVMLWSEHFSASRIFKHELERLGPKILYSEFGEFPGSFLISAQGLFHEAWPVRRKSQFQGLPLDPGDLHQAEKYMDRVTRKKQSTKMHSYTQTEGMKTLGLDPSRPVLYLNAVQPHASGFMPRSSAFSREYSPWFGSNWEILNTFAKWAESNGWTILYKEHPNTHDYFPMRSIRKNEWGPHVKIIGNLDIHEIFAVADMTVSLGSKSVFLSLMAGVPVLLLGPYSIGPDDLSHGVTSQKPFEKSVQELLRPPRGERVDRDGLTRFVARMFRYYLYPMDQETRALFDRGPEVFWHDLNEYVENKRSIVSTDALT